MNWRAAGIATVIVLSAIGVILLHRYPEQALYAFVWFMAVVCSVFLWCLIYLSIDDHDD